MNIAAEDPIEIMRYLLDAYVQGDTASFNVLVLDDCVFADEGSLRGKAEELKYVTRPTDTVKVAMSFEPSVTRVHDNCATVIGYLTETVHAGEPSPTNSKFLLTDTLVRKDGLWKLAARHQTRILDPRKEIVLDRPDLLTQQAGRYVFASDMALEIFLDNDKLYAQLQGRQEQELHPLSLNEFFETEFDAQITFVPDAEGAISTIMLRQAGQIFFAHKAPKEQGLGKSKTA
jgi:Domain of unknown function (DUF4440)